MPANPRDDLRPRLEQARKTLDEALSVACAADVGSADTGELIRIEEVLAIANEAAKEAISVRRRIAQEESSTPQLPATQTGPAHREIEDATGVRWVAFAVYPSQTSTGRKALHDRFQQGWLAFDSGVETRRLTPIPDGWRGLSDHDLRQLCEVAEVAPKRVKDRPQDA